MNTITVSSPPLVVVYRPVADLVPYANNARTHSESQVAQIAASIKEFGFNNPILLDGSSGIIAGHGRLAAAQKLKLAEVPTIDLGHLTDAQRRAYILADNRLALSAGWDEDLLKIEFESLLGEGVDLNLLGFEDDDIARILGEVTGDDAAGDQSGDIDGVFEVLVVCDGEPDQVALLEELSERGFKCRALIS